MSLILIHSVLSQDPTSILNALPSRRYFALISSVLQENGKRSVILLTNEDDAYVWGYYAPYRELRPVYAYSGQNDRAIIVSEESPKQFIDTFLALTDAKVSVKYHDKGIVEFSESHDSLPWLIAGLRVHLSSINKQARCRYLRALPTEPSKKQHIVRLKVRIPR